MQILLRCAKESYNYIIKLLKRNIPLLLEDTEELVRRCEKKAIKTNGEIHKNAFYFGYNRISTDRSKYRTYQETFKYIPADANPDKWGLIKGIVKYIRRTTGVIEVIADPKKENPAHALIVCDPDDKKKKDIASDLSKIFTEVSDKEYRI